MRPSPLTYKNRVGGTKDKIIAFHKNSAIPARDQTICCCNHIILLPVNYKLLTMLFTSKNCRFALVLVAACNAVTSAVDIGSAKNYVILAKSGIVSSSSDITGDIAVSPIAATAITGFVLVPASNGAFSKSSQLSATSKAFAADYAVPTPATLTIAVSDMEAAYTAAKSLLNSDAARINLGDGILGGDFGGAASPLTPGVYSFTTGVTITKNIYFHGDATDVFTMQIFGKLVQAADTQVMLTGGALASNVFWQVSLNAHIGAGAHMEGILLVKTSVLFVTGSSLKGRVLSQTAVNLQMATINVSWLKSGRGMVEGW
jgi:hypothetical protein